MSLETSIAALVQQAGLLLDLPQQIVTTANGRIVAIGAEYTTRMATMAKTVCVSQVAGQDTNPGTTEAPVKSLGRALEMVPPGGAGIIRLQSDYLIGGQEEEVRIFNRHITIQSDSSTRWRLSFTPLVLTVSGTNYRALRAFYLYGNASLILSGLRVAMPDVNATLAAGSNAAAASIFHLSGLVRRGSDADYCWTNFAMRSCDVEMTATPFGIISGYTLGLNAFGGHSHCETAITLVGGATSLNGYRFIGATNTAGTAATGFASLVTNLVNV